MTVVNHRGYQFTQADYTGKVCIISDSGNKVLTDTFTRKLSESEAQKLIDKMIEFQAQVKEVMG